MRYEPHDYQRYCSDYLISHKISALLLSMGLGKTVITLSAIADLLFDYFDIRRVLIIAPLRVAQMTWPDELKKWDHLKGLRYSVAVGSAKERKQAVATQADLYIINRDNVVWLCENYPEFFDKDLMIVVDELSSFKSHQSKMGARLGRFIGTYRELYFKPDRMNGPIVYSYKPLPGAEDRIYEKISDMTISMKSTDHLKMPELISTSYEVQLSDEEAKTYKALKDQLVLNLPAGEITVANAAVLSGKLCQMANGAVYGDDGQVVSIHDRKLDALEDIIESMNGNPLLLCYYFRHDHERITGRLNEKGIPWEDINSEEAIRRWNDKNVPVGLIHCMSAGHGLNLQHGGNAMCWFGLSFSLEAYQQTIGRLYRQGQQSETVVVVHIIAKGTIDERVMRVLSEKDDTQTALIDAVRAEVRNVKEESHDGKRILEPGTQD